MAVPSDQFNGEYGIPSGLMFSYPMTCANGKYELVRGLNLDDYSKEMIKITTEELLEERNTVEHLLK
jgi:malate dehydrogenase